MRADRRVRALGLLALGAGLALLGYLAFHSGLAPITGALGSLGIWGLVVVTLAHLPVVAVMGIAWWWIARATAGIGCTGFIWARAVRDAASEALPFSQVGGYVIGARALTIAGAHATLAGASTLVDLIVELSAKLPYLLIGLSVLEYLRPSRAALSAAVLALAATIALAVLASELQPRAEGMVGKVIARAAQRWPRLQVSRARLTDAFTALGRRPALRTSLVLHFVCWLMGTAETWLIFHLMHVPVRIGAALTIDSLVGAIRAVGFFVPGAIGIQEGGYVLLCGLFGLPAGVAIALSLARRARDIVIAVPILVSWKYREAAALLADEKPPAS